MMKDIFRNIESSINCIELIVKIHEDIKIGKKMSIHFRTGKPFPLLIGIGLLILAICSCTITDHQSPQPILSSLPAERTDTIPPIFTPTEVLLITQTPFSSLSSTPILTFTPFATMAPPYYNPISSLKPGQYFLYKSSAHPFSVISEDGQENLELILPSTWTGYTNIQLSPDHKKLELARAIIPGDRERGTLMIVDLEKGVGPILMEGIDCFGSSWSPDGNYLLASCDTSLFLFSLVTGEKFQLPTECWGICNDVRWSPDGKWIIFQTGVHMDSSLDGVFLVSTDCFSKPSSCSKNNLGRISPLYDTPQAWSPDGKFVVMKSRRDRSSEENTVELEFIDVQTKLVQHRIEIPGTNERYLRSLAWSPDGEWIAFNQKDGIYKVRIEGGSPVLVAQSPFPYINQWINVP
jgi:Tol biopolymer transport system component